MTFHNVIILIKSVVDNNENSYFDNTFLEKGSDKDKSDTQYFEMTVCILWMLYFNRIEVSEGINVNNKINASKECDICHF